jgi:hypothetical protein
MDEVSIDAVKLQALRAQADSNWAEADALWGQAERMIDRAMAEAPADMALAQRRAFVVKQRKNISRKVKLGAHGARDGKGAFTAALSFPHVRRVIGTKFHPENHPWVEYTEIQEGLLEDAEAREDIDHWAEILGLTPQQVAVMVQGLWNKAFGQTIEPDPTIEYELRSDRNAYRPRNSR